ncbi:hypothetical protein [Acidisoma sp. C75]
MIEIEPEDIVATRLASDGRFLIFLSYGVTPGWPLKFWGVVADTGSDGHGMLVRLDAMVACDGWTLPQLLKVARARLAAERERAGDSAREAESAVVYLDRALAVYANLPVSMSAEVTFEAGEAPSPYPWTVARFGEFDLPLCPDHVGREEGITPEQLLIVMDQMLEDWTRAAPQLRKAWELRAAVRGALAAEVLRSERYRAAAGGT